jgi:thioesterase domain-containing protein
MRVLRANVLAGIRYRPAAGYPGRLTVISASERKRGDPSLGWGRLAEGGAIGHIVPGDHSSILDEPGVRIMAAILSSEMHRVREALG